LRGSIAAHQRRAAPSRECVNAMLLEEF